MTSLERYIWFVDYSLADRFHVAWGRMSQREIKQEVTNISFVNTDIRGRKQEGRSILVRTTALPTFD